MAFFIHRSLVKSALLVVRNGKQFSNPSFKNYCSKLKFQKIKLKVDGNLPIICHKIHTTTSKNAIQPIIVFILRPIIKIAAMLFGRTIRKWWQRLKPEERAVILKKLRSKTTHISFGVTLFFGMVMFYYVEHLEEDPLTKRKRFIMYSDEQMSSIADMEYHNQLATYKKEVIPSSHPIYHRVVRVSNRILKGNKSIDRIRNKKWAVTVIDRPDVVNAFVLPNGKIIVFTGLLNIASNDDQLAVVMSHEIAHNLLSHQAENLSRALLLDIFLLIPLVLIWALLPDAAAIFSQWLQGRLADIMINLPFSRSIEREADVVGLDLAARSCFDIREAPVFWGKMAQVNNMREPLEWLSTHPNHKSRQAELSQLLSAAIGLRASCQCPQLPPASAAQVFYFEDRKH